MTKEQIELMECAVSLMETTLILSDRAVQNAKESGIPPEAIAEFEAKLLPSRKKHAECVEKLRVAKGLPPSVMN